jgi:hypothetical protein
MISRKATRGKKRQRIGSNLDSYFIISEMEGSCPTPKCGQDVVASFPEVLDGGQRELQWRKLLQPGDQDQSHEKLG